MGMPRERLFRSTRDSASQTRRNKASCGGQSACAARQIVEDTCLLTRPCRLHLTSLIFMDGGFDRRIVMLVHVYRCCLCFHDLETLASTCSDISHPTCVNGRSIPRRPHLERLLKRRQVDLPGQPTHPPRITPIPILLDLRGVTGRRPRDLLTMHWPHRPLISNQ